MSKSFKSKVLFELDTDLKKANKEIGKLEKSLDDAKWASKEAKAGTDQHKLALIQQQRSLATLRKERKQAIAAQKKHTLAQKAGTASAQQQTMATKAMSAALKAVPFVLAAVGISKLIGFGKDLIAAGTEWEGTVKGLEKEVFALSKSVDGMIGDVPLSRLAEFQKELGLTQEQTNSVAKAAIAYGRINKVDFASSLKIVTDAAVTARTSGLMKLGIAINVTGTKTEKTSKVINELHKKFGDVKISAGNAAEALDKMNNELEREKAAIGANIVKSKQYQSAIKGTHKLYLNSIKLLGKVIELYQEENTMRDFYFKGVKDALKQARINHKLETAVVKEEKEKQVEVVKKMTLKQRIAAEQFQAYIMKLTDFAEKQREEKAKAHGKKMVKLAKGDYNSHIKLFDTVQKKRKKGYQLGLRLERQYQDKMKGYDEDRYDYQKGLESRRLELKKVTSEKEKEEFETRRDMINNHTQAFTQAALANALSASSFGGFMQKMAADTVNYLSQMAIKKGAFELAEGFATLATTWGVPNPASIAHFTAAGMYLALGGAGAAIGSSMSSGGGGGSSASPKPTTPSSPTFRDSAAAQSSSSSSNQGPAPVTIINNFNGRGDFLTSDDMKGFAKKRNQGRR